MTTKSTLLAALALLLFLFTIQKTTAYESEMAKILREFYRSTNGDNWKNNYGWNNATSGDPCEDNWYGVKCSGGGMINIHLQRNNLVGTIPKSFGRLGSLWILDLSYNYLTGTIPQEVANMNIMMVSFMSNNLQGVLPVQFCNMPTCVMTNNPALQCPANNCVNNHCLLEACNCGGRQTCVDDSNCRGLCRKCRGSGYLKYCQ